MKKMFMWAAAIFMGLAAIVYFPSVTSVISIVFVLVALPVEKLQNFWEAHGLRGGIKAAVLCLAFLGAVLAAPTSKKAGLADTPSPQPTALETPLAPAPAQTARAHTGTYSRTHAGAYSLPDAEAHAPAHPKANAGAGPRACPHSRVRPAVGRDRDHQRRGQRHQ